MAHVDSCYAQSDFMAKLKAQSAERFCLFSDIDNTFHTEDSFKAMTQVVNSCKAKNIPIVLVTGNDYLHTYRRIESGDLAPVSIIAGSVGTEIWVLQRDGKYVEDRSFYNRLIQSGFVRTSIVDLAGQMIQTARKDYPDWELDFQHPDKEQKLVDQPDPAYQTFKVSFYFYATHETYDAVLSLAQQYFPRQKLIVCEEINHNRTLPADSLRLKFNLDVLPVTKAETVNYLCNIGDIKRGIVAGDSGNDVQMLLDTALDAVLVGGARPEALSAIRRVAVPTDDVLLFTMRGKDKMIYIESDQNLRAARSLFKAFNLLY